jgi:two-component system chemotaxis response regulator CheY
MAKVLIVDDSFFIRNRLANWLAQQGHETNLAGDGVEAVSVYRQARPDVVLMDVTMPRKNGLQAMAEIRQFDPQAKVIVLTALDQPAVASEAIQLGAEDFLAKPLDYERLFKSLRKVLR